MAVGLCLNVQEGIPLESECQKTSAREAMLCLLPSRLLSLLKQTPRFDFMGAADFNDRAKVTTGKHNMEQNC